MTPQELNRYARHLSLSEIGEAGQERLKAARVLIVGVGGLGCPAALYLTAAGIGKIGTIDPDRVDLTNLQRQVLFEESDVGLLKVEVAKARLQALNSSIDIQPYPFALDATNALELIQSYDLVLDATDNFETRYLVNDACYFLKKTNIFASVSHFEGRLTVFSPDGPCYRCLFPWPPKEVVLNCAEEGILGAVPGVLGTLQAIEAVKLILQLGLSAGSQLHVFDLLKLKSHSLQRSRNPSCPLCGKSPTVRTLESAVATCAPQVPRIRKSELEALSAVHLIDVREIEEFKNGSLPGAHCVPLAKILNNEFDPPEDQSIVLFCKSGKRSDRAARHLIQRGYRQIFSLLPS